MSVCYLEIDDEITGAIGRIRAVTDDEVIVVVPPGSRIATSRINFKLLGKEANERRLNIVAVSDEPQVRALAISAGIPTYDSLPAAEQALAKFRDADRRLAERAGRSPDEPPAPPRATASASAGVAASGDVPTETMVLPSPLREAPSVEGRARPATPDSSAGASTAATAATSVLPASVGPTAVAAGTPAAADTLATRRQRKQSRVSIAPLVVIGLLLLLVAGVGYGAYTFLPTATITITPSTTELRPSPFAVTADPHVAVVDVPAGVVPAELVELPLHVTGTFPATGVETRETRAAGQVRFRSENTLDQVAVPDGTVVATADGTQFLTTQAATIPRADFATSTPGTVDVPVRAVEAGPRGNVPEGSINQLPAPIAAQLVSVRNPRPTDGGQRIEEASVTRADYDAAVDSLAGQLDGALEAALADPNSVPRGLTTYPSTATFGEGRPDQPANAVVGTVAPSFSLGLEAPGTVVAVNEALVDELAAARVRTGLSADQRLLGDQVASGRSSGEVEGETVVYEVAPTALVFSAPDDAELATLIRGKSVEEARQALARYGDVTIEMWPEFIDRIPDQAARIRVNVAPPGAES
ncbi:MAG TPA: baseplate J/gp47 family protein [Candidatus Limnocylindrales bacterium]|nr:baseplate J/gp47 family protein [Candidatus Limnocylindrales bacterium]